MKMDIKLNFLSKLISFLKSLCLIHETFVNMSKFGVICA